MMDQETQRVQKPKAEILMKKLWEAELFISGGALFTVWQAGLLLMQFYQRVISINFTQSVVIAMLLFAIFVLGGGFFMHLLIRGFWFSLYILNKLNPAGINFEKVKLGEPYLSQTKKFDLKTRIITLDRISSTIFSTTFVLTLMVIGFAITIGFIYIPFQILQEYPSLEDNYLFGIGFSIFFIAWILFIYVDLFTAGLLRRGKIVGKLYYPIYIFFNTLSLGFLWRPLLVTILSNLKSRKVALGIFLIVIIIAHAGILVVSDAARFIQLFDTREHEIAPVVLNNHYYRDQLPQENWLSDATIQSNIITSNYLEIYVRYSEFVDVEIDSLETQNKYFSDLITLSMNDSVLTKPTWTALELRQGQRVAATVVDVLSLSKSLHNLEVRIKGGETILIPFWKE